MSTRRSEANKSRLMFQSRRLSTRRSKANKSRLSTDTLIYMSIYPNSSLNTDNIRALFIIQFPISYSQFSVIQFHFQFPFISTQISAHKHVLQSLTHSCKTLFKNALAHALCYLYSTHYFTLAHKIVLRLSLSHY